MLVAQARWLPQYRAALPAARRRLAAGPGLARYGTQGACRKAAAGVASVAARAARTEKKRKSGKKLDIAEPEG
jgi:hypothetical protein